MGPNKAEQVLETRLTNKIQYLERELNALKTRQILGGDNFPIRQSSVVEFDTGFLSPFQSYTALVTVVPTVDRIIFSQCQFSVFIYGTGLPNPAYLIPGGTAPGMAQVTAETRIHHREDHYLTDLDGGLTRAHLFTITNDQDTASRRYRIYAKFYALGQV